MKLYLNLNRAYKFLFSWLPRSASLSLDVHDFTVGPDYRCRARCPFDHLNNSIRNYLYWFWILLIKIGLEFQSSVRKHSFVLPGGYTNGSILRWKPNFHVVGNETTRLTSLINSGIVQGWCRLESTRIKKGVWYVQTTYVATIFTFRGFVVRGHQKFCLKYRIIWREVTLGKPWQDVDLKICLNSLFKLMFSSNNEGTRILTKSIQISDPKKNFCFN